MSYNIDFKNKTFAKLKNRENIINIIARENPDIVGLQEAEWLNPDKEPLKSMDNLNNMGGFAIKNNGGNSNYTSMILFNRNKFIKVSEVYKNLHNRGINVIKLEHKKTKKHIIVINVHLDHMWNGTHFKGKNEIRKTIKLLNDAIKEINYNKGDHIIFMGDTNEFYLEFTNVKKYKFPLELDNNINFWMVNAGKTCCRNDPKEVLDYKSDVFGTNNQNLLTTLDSGKKLGEWGIFGSNPLSDHTWITAEYNLDGVIADVVEMDKKELWAYDFDGVIHKLMNPGEDFTTSHRNPDHGKLSSKFVKNYKYLIPYLFKHTIDDIKDGISKGINIKIVSANSDKYTKPIFDLLKSQGINLKQTHFSKTEQHNNIDKNDIIMRVSPKIDMLEKLKVNKFVDDSCYNIKAIYDAYKNEGRISTLKQLIFAIPEYESYYNVKLSKVNDIEICKGYSKIWGKNLLENKLKNVNLLYSDYTFLKKDKIDQISDLRRQLKELEDNRDKLDLKIIKLKDGNKASQEKYVEILKEKKAKIESLKQQLKDLKVKVPPPPLPPADNDVYKGTLANVGNSCYLNTSIQFLYNIKILRDEILKLQQTTIDNLNNKKNENNILTILYYIFDLLNKNMKKINLKDYYLPNGKTYYNSIIDIFDFTCNSQEDAEEAIRGLLDKLLDTEKLRHLRTNLQIDVEQNKYCENDNNILKKDEVYLDLNLQIKQNITSKLSLYNLLDNYTSYEYVDPKDRDHKLDECKDSKGNKYPIKGTKVNFNISPLNKNIIIQLKRFDYSTGVPLKIYNNVNIEDEIIVHGSVYRLKGIGVHSGTEKSGHYVYINKVGKDKYIYNDADFAKYDSDTFQLEKNAYMLNYELIDDIDKSQLFNLYYDKIINKFERLNNVDFILNDIYNIINSVSEFKKDLDVINRLISEGTFLEPSKRIIINKINFKIKEKQERLRKYNILKNPFDFNTTIKELSMLELNTSLTNGDTLDLINNTNNFSYQKPNSASNSNIFRGYWDGKKCFMKTFTLSGNSNLEYEQKIYNYINERNKQLNDEFSDNFVNIYRVFKIKRNDFKTFYNTKTFQGMKVRFTDTSPYSGKHIRYNNETYIYFIVTEDIGGSTVADFYKQQCTNFSHKFYLKNPNRNIYRDNIMEMLFELIYGLYLLNTRLRVIHNDNHFSNLLIKEQPDEKIYTINNTEYTRRRKYRVCIYDFDLSYFENNTNPDSRLKPNNRTNQINSVVPLTDVNKGRDIYTIGNSLYGYSMYIKKILNMVQFNELIKNNSENTYNIFRILFETDNVINNVVKNFEYDTQNNKLFWNSYCVTGKKPCVPVDFNNITAEKVLTRMLNSNDLKHVLNISNIDTLFKKYLKYKVKYINYKGKN